jgi:moderate conductance mechanosensitive channel
MRSISRPLAWSLTIPALLWMAFASAQAQPAAPDGAPPAQVQQLLKLLQDPAVRTWIEREQKSPPASSAQPKPLTTTEAISERISQLREHFAGIVAAVPTLPTELRQAAGALMDELQGRSLARVLVLVLAFLALGAGVEWLFRRGTRSLKHPSPASVPASGHERLRAVALHLAFELCAVVVFALGSIGAFLAFDWPPLLKKVVVGYLAATVVVRLVLTVARSLLLPDPAAAEVDPGAPTRRRRLTLFIAWLAFGIATADALKITGLAPTELALVSYILGLGLLLIAISIVWARPRPAPGASGKVPHAAKAALLSAYLVLLWVLWVGALMGLFWLGVTALLLPVAIKASERAARRLLDDREGSGKTALTAVYLDRGVRALLILGAVALLAHALEIDFASMTSRDTVVYRLARGVLTSIVILLVADLLWQVMKTLIDRRLALIGSTSLPGSEEALREARLRTLLPIFRIVSFVVMAVVAVLMVLSALGVEIGPLIAGAGIFGVAIGFGSQAIVRDVISGIFYLLDDAFRIGEYIQSGNYKGTVESLGFRSVRLRHHRGPIYIVPYGSLGAVQNTSRDWVIDKMTIGVTYDTDLDKAKKLIKQVGNQLAENPEYKDKIIEPLKMQGVEEFGDFAIQIRMKMMTRPGEQFVIRRRAYAMIKAAFDQNGIKFAYPTVQVAGGQEAQLAAAQEALKVLKPPPAA